MGKIDTTADDLRNIAELSDFSDNVLTEAAALADHTEARPGDTLVREGVVSHQAYIVLQGHASVFIDGEPIASFGPSSLIGDVSLSDEPAPATVRAVTAMRLVVLGPGARATLARAMTVGGTTEEERLEDARQHAGDVHGIEVTREQITAGGA